MKLHDKKLSPRLLLWGGIMLAGLILLVLTMLATHGQSFQDILYCRAGDTFYDFTISIQAAETRHDYKGNYPPLAQLFFYVLSWMMPAQYKGLHIRQLIALPLGAMYVMFFFTAVTVWINWLIEDKLRAPKWACRLCMVLLFFSVPYIYGVQRGNVLFICLPLIMIFAFYFDSQKPLMRFFAMAALAVAAGFKLYPAVLGLILLRERRWKQAAGCILLGIAAVLLPALFYDGIDTLVYVANKILAVSDTFSDRGVGHQLGFDNFIRMINQGFQLDLNVSACYIGMIVLILVTFFLSKKRWQQFSLLCAAMIIFPSFSFTYTMIFMILPLVLYLNDESPFTWLDILYCTFFAMCFVVIPFGGGNAFAFTQEQYYNLNISSVAENLGINLLILTISIQVFFEAIASRKKLT